MSFDPPSVSRRDALRITAAVGIAAVAGGHTAMEIIRRAGLHRVSVSKARLGTLVEIDVVHPDRDGAHEMIRGAFAEIDRLESILSRHRTDSALSMLNRAGEVIAPSHDLVTVLESALHIARMTDGAFDPTVLPLLEVHASSFSVSGRPPEPDVLRRTVQRVGHQNVVVSEERVALMRPDMGVTLDGIGKGYVVDRTVQALVRAGAERVLVDAGGDIASGGERSKEDPWRIGLQHPRTARLVGVVDLAGRSVATSGDYMRSFTEDRSHHHIIDPRTGVSPEETAGASIVAESAMEADALSTAALVLGPEKALLLLDGMAGVEGLLVTKDGEIHSTSGMP